MTDAEIIVAVAFGLWLLGLSLGVRHLSLHKVDWEDHERYASYVRELRHDAILMPRWMKRIRFWRLVWRTEWERVKSRRLDD